MKLFTCTSCGQLVFFENVLCTHCGHQLAYLPDKRIVSAVELPADAPNGSAVVALSAGGKGGSYHLCANYLGQQVCNWAVPDSDPNPFCLSCRLDDTIPNLSNAKSHEAWHRLEQAKRRLLYTLLGLRLPVESRVDRPVNGLAFSFKEDDASEKVFTGHSDGLITINVAEADDPFREKRRLDLGETYRTLLGHFRHEIGHYYWDRLIKDGAHHAAFRDVFGDERVDYDESLKRHYAEGAPADWQTNFVSSYASMHPWEDFAESWAHYLHIVETLDTARNYGMALRPSPVGGGKGPRILVTWHLDFDDFDDLIAAWIPLTTALNSMNRAMGLADLYPFVLSERAISKLRFVHDVVENASKEPPPARPARPALRGGAEPKGTRDSAPSPELVSSR